MSEPRSALDELIAEATKNEPGITVRAFDWIDSDSCAYLAKGFCAASVDGYCVGGTSEGKCHG